MEASISRGRKSPLGNASVPVFLLGSAGRPCLHFRQPCLTCPMKTKSEWPRGLFKGLCERVLSTVPCLLLFPCSHSLELDNQSVDLLPPLALTSILSTITRLVILQISSNWCHSCSLLPRYHCGWKVSSEGTAGDFENVRKEAMLQLRVRQTR